MHFKKCLGLTPRNPQTLIAIGFVHALQGNYGQAIEYLHQGLWLSPASSFAQTLLNKCFNMTQSKTYVETLPGLNSKSMRILTYIQLFRTTERFK